MANDPIGTRGFAVVLPKSNHIGALTNLAEKRRQFDVQMDMKRQEQAQEWFDKNSKLQWKEVDYRVQKPLTELFTKAYALMNGAYKQSNGKLTPDLMDVVTESRMEFDAAQQMSSSYSKEILQLDEIIKNDKHGRYNKGYVAQRLQQTADQAWTTDDLGLPVWNKDAQTPMEILKDPKAVSLQGLVSEYLDNIETIEAAEVEDMGNYTQTSTYKFKPLYETGKDGLPVLDPNTGKYIPKASPQSVALWDQDSDRKTQLDLLAADNKISRADAFKKFIVEPSAAVSKKIAGGRDYKPEYVVNPKNDDEQVDLVYPILDAIVEDRSVEALQQLAIGNENLRFRYEMEMDPANFDGDFKSFPQTDRKKPGKSYIIVEKMQPGYNIQSGQNDGPKTWREYDRIYLDEKEEAFSVLSQYFDATNDTKLSQKLFDKRKKKTASQKPKQSEADQFGLN